ncbi:MAG: WYL domain-containing protein [Actinomycetia bacterium]|nr:WYL domain-containing protein [Actinomycetes bacterium]
MEKIERLINLTAYLLESGRPVTFGRLCRTVYADVSSKGPALHRMFERDKDELREMGIEVRAETLEPEGETGYTIPRDEYYLPHLELSPAERVALTMVSRLFLGSGTPFSGPAHSALLKFAFDVEGGVDADAVPHVHWVGVPRDRRLLNAILDGLTGHKDLRFSYRSMGSSEPVQREVSPYGLFNRRGSWYLVGRCHLRREVRSFKLDRVTSPIEVNRKKPHKPDFEVPDSFDLRSETRWEWPGGTGGVSARVRFEPRLAYGFSGGGARVEGSRRREDGSVDVTYVVEDPEEFVDWILEFGAGARILSPPGLVDLAVERIRGALEAVEGNA